MPESGKPAQAIECLADIRKFGGASSAILVFDSGQLDGGNEQPRDRQISQSGAHRPKFFAADETPETPASPFK
jgi:hypothetical protein